MTAEQKEIVRDLFTGYYCHDGHREIKIWGSIHDPEKLSTAKDIQFYDGSAARMIAEFKAIIAKLEIYRLAMAERYGEIETAPKIPVVKLTRDRSYSANKVYYYLTIYERFIETGKENQIDQTRYDGKDRHKALADFEAYKKAHPGIVAEMDIEKKRWER